MDELVSLFLAQDVGEPGFITGASRFFFISKADKQSVCPIIDLFQLTPLVLLPSFGLPKLSKVQAMPMDPTNLYFAKLDI